MGLEIEAEDERNFVDQLRDGVLLCQLVNKIKSGSVDVVRSDPNYGYDPFSCTYQFQFVCATSLAPYYYSPDDSSITTCSCCSYSHVSTTTR